MRNSPNTVTRYFYLDNELLPRLTNKADFYVVSVAVLVKSLIHAYRLLQTKAEKPPTTEPKTGKRPLPTFAEFEDL